jgi:hypothetical protein
MIPKATGGKSGSVSKQLLKSSGQAAQPMEEPKPRYGEPMAVFPRLGQGSFRLIGTCLETKPPFREPT